MFCSSVVVNQVHGSSKFCGVVLVKFNEHVVVLSETSDGGLAVRLLNQHATMFYILMHERVLSNKELIASVFWVRR